MRQRRWDSVEVAEQYREARFAARTEASGDAQPEHQRRLDLAERLMRKAERDAVRSALGRRNPGLTKQERNVVYQRRHRARETLRALNGRLLSREFRENITRALEHCDDYEARVNKIFPAFIEKRLPSPSTFRECFALSEHDRKAHHVLASGVSSELHALGRHDARINYCLNEIAATRLLWDEGFAFVHHQRNDRTIRELVPLESFFLKREGWILAEALAEWDHKTSLGPGVPARVDKLELLLLHVEDGAVRCAADLKLGIRPADAAFESRFRARMGEHGIKQGHDHVAMVEQAREFVLTRASGRQRYLFGATTRCSYEKIVPAIRNEFRVLESAFSGTNENAAAREHAMTLFDRVLIRPGRQRASDGHVRVPRPLQFRP